MKKEEIVMGLYAMRLQGKNRVAKERNNTVDRAVELIDQLDEPEVTLDKAFEKVAESYLMTKEEIWRHLERLETHGGKVTYDELEVLSQDWIDEHAQGGCDEWVYIDDLQNLLVPKQDKPVIPQFVAYVIEAYKSNSRLTNLLADLAFHGELAEFVEHEDEDEVFEWARSNRKATDEILARAWLDGFTVEEEQKYYVINKQGAFALRKDTGGVANSIYTKKEVERLGELQYYQLTEQEVKDYDERYWPFAEEVTE